MICHVFYKWIHNSAELIKSGDAAAVKVHEEKFLKGRYDCLPTLSEGDIEISLLII
jgi:hypothetical protein